MVNSRSVDDHLELVEEQRRTFRDDFRTNSAEKDRIVIALSGGALATSMAFLADRPDPVWSGLLIAALVALALAVAFVLWSLHANSGQIARSIRYIDDWKKSPIPAGPKDGAYKFKVGRREIRALDALNALDRLPRVWARPHGRLRRSEHPLNEKGRPMPKRFKAHGPPAERGNSYTQPSVPAKQQSPPKPPKAKKK